MNAIKVVFKKELIDTIRDRRSLASALVFGPLMGPLLFALVLTTTLETERSRAEATIRLPVAGRAHAPNLVTFLEQHGVEILPAPADPVAAVKSEESNVILKIPEAFADQLRSGKPATVVLILDRSRRKASAEIGRVRRMVRAYGKYVGHLRLQVRGIDPRVPIALVLEEQDLSTPQSRGALILGMLPFLVMMSIFIGSMYLAIDATAGERERGSLEALLLNPVARWKLMAGKLAATALLGVTSLALLVATFVVAMGFIPIAELGIQVRMDPLTGLWIFLVVLPMTVVAAAMQTIISAFTQSFREAQTYVSMLMLIPMIPTLVVMLATPQSKLWMMLVPMLSQSLLLDTLVRGHAMDSTFVLVSVVSTTLLGLGLSGVSAALYSRERLLFTS